jgi:Zn-dependent metalloprotease
MMKLSLLLTVTSLPAVLFGAAVNAAPNGNVGIGRDDDGQPGLHGSSSAFLTGDDLGVVPPSKVSLVQEDPSAVKEAAAVTLRGVLRSHFGFTGKESIVPIHSQPIRTDKQNIVHIRYKQLVEGLPLEGASISIHFDGRSGRVKAVNGEFHTSEALDGSGKDGNALDCEAAMEIALLDYKEQAGTSDVGMWNGDCQFAAVQGRDGKPYLAYKRLYEIEPVAETIDNQTTSEYRRDLIFAERFSGQLVAVHPTIAGARTMTTYHCHNQDYDGCTVATTSPDKISFGDPPLDDAHNHVIDVYDFYKQHFGRTGMDGNDLQLQTLAHYKLWENNAYFSTDFGGVLVFGDGDGWSQGYFGRFDIGTFELFVVTDKVAVTYRCSFRY